MRSLTLLLGVAVAVAVAVAGPCDILDAGNTPCVAAHSLVRALYSNYNGPLYTVQRRSDNATLNISTLETGGFADTSPQDSFCSQPSSKLPALGTITTLTPSSIPTHSFRHCDAQGFATPTDKSPDHLFKVVAALNGAPGAVSFQSINYPTYHLAPVAGAEPGRVGIVDSSKTSKDDAQGWAEASWSARPAAAVEGGFTLTNLGRPGQVMQPGNNLTGACALMYKTPAVSVYLGLPPTTARTMNINSDGDGDGDGDDHDHDEASSTAWHLGSDKCDIVKIYDQSPWGNHLDVGPAGGTVRTPDDPVVADGFPVTIAGHKVYGAYFEGGMGYRRDNTSGIATGDDPETIYSVFSGSVYNPGCCMDYGNAETDNDADGPGMRVLLMTMTMLMCVCVRRRAPISRRRKVFDLAGCLCFLVPPRTGTMECVYFGTWNATRSGWCGGSGEGPWIMADLEAGLWACEKPKAINPSTPSMKGEYVIGLVKGKPGLWGVKAGNATDGPLVKTFEGPRPPLYATLLPFVVAEMARLLLSLG